jgi:hypothetical protein
LKARKEATFTEIYEAVLPSMTNGRTPEESEIYEILDKIAEKDAAGKWHLKVMFTDLSIPTEQVGMEQFLGGQLPQLDTSKMTHEAVLYMIARLGQAAGNQIWIGKKEQAGGYANQSFADLCSIDLRSLNLPPELCDVIEQIDVIWFDKGLPVWAFEVEHTTGIISGIDRFENLLDTYHYLRLKMYIIAPDKREKEVMKKINRPSHREVAKECRFIPYSRLIERYEAIRNQNIPIRPELVDVISKPCTE